MFPDFSFRVVRVVPRVARLTRSSRITLLNKKTEKYPLSPHFKPAVRFSDIVGQIEAKQKCLVILKYLEDPQSFGTWAPHNILLCGPPGTGKTMTAKALACEAKVEILPVRASDLLGSFVGDASGRIHKLFDEARYHAPSVIFIDELDVIALQRNFQSIRGDVTEVVSALLSELDGVFENQGVVTLAASNRFDMLDEAIKSRFEQIIEFKLPTLEEREDILAINSTLSPISIHANMRRIATLTTNWSGRDLKEKLLRRAIHAAIINNEEEITEETLTKIIEKQKTHPKQLYT
ncbi:MAG: AAA family ATPase [Promethearchaeota archaeon]